MTQFDIEFRCGGHSVTKKFMTILQILLAKPKLWKKKSLYFISNTFSMLKFTFFLLENGKMLLPVPKNGQLKEKFIKKLNTLFARWRFFF